MIKWPHSCYVHSHVMPVSMVIDAGEIDVSKWKVFDTVFDAWKFVEEFECERFASERF